MGRLIPKGTAQGHAVLEKLVERGLVEAKGEKKGRGYHLHATLYAQLGKHSESLHALQVNSNLRRLLRRLFYLPWKGRIEEYQ